MTHRQQLIVGFAAFLIGLIIVLIAFRDVTARTTATCWWEGSVLKASGLPDRPFAVTLSRVPIGVSRTSEDGTFSLDIVGSQIGSTAYFWTRGGGGALFKPGPQYNDYHPIAVCERTE